MKRWRVVAVLLICLALTGSVACLPFGGGDDEEEAEPDRRSGEGAVSSFRLAVYGERPNQAA